MTHNTVKNITKIHSNTMLPAMSKFYYF